MSNAKGSTWSKWDLHVHTPASIVQNYGGDTDAAWERFFQDIEKLPSEFKVIGINDYIFVDGYEKVLSAKKAGRLPNIDLILPVIELRLDKFSGVVKKEANGSYSASDWNRINLHIIFDQLDPELIRQQFLSGLAPTYQLTPESEGFKSTWNAIINKQSVEELGTKIIAAAPEVEKRNYRSPLEEGFNNICFSLTNITEALKRHAFEGRALTAIGKAEWANMKWNDHSIAEKRNVINSTNLVFTASENPATYETAKAKLEEEQVLGKLLDCSDAHDFSSSEHKDRIGNCFTWIKAEPSFQGLQQALHEFDQRIFVGDTPPKQLLIDANRTKYISEVKITKMPGSPSLDSWFNVEIPINSDLVAVIGNKGSGKSALSDAIALAGDTKNDKFSFLHDKKFRNPRKKFAKDYSVELTWRDGTKSNKTLSDNPSSSSVERVKYLPQSHIETLCNELALSGSPAFDSELREIIYTHVPNDQRLGFSSLTELLNFKIEELEREKQRLSASLSTLNLEITVIENRMAPGYRQTLEAQLETRQKELGALESAKPAEIANPGESESSKQESVEKTARISVLEKSLQGIQLEEKTANEAKLDANKRLMHLQKASQAVKSFSRNYDQFVIELDAILSEIDASLSPANLVKLIIDTKPLDDLSETHKETLKKQDFALSTQAEGSIRSRRNGIEVELNEIKNQLGEKSRLYLRYREQLQQWENSKSELQGSHEKINSIAWIELEIKKLELLPVQLAQYKQRRSEIVRGLHGLISDMVGEYRKLYEPVQQFVQSAEKTDMSLPLDFNVQIVNDSFSLDFLEFINRQTRGTFSGVDESEQIISKLLAETDFMDVESAIKFVEGIDERLHADMRDPGNVASVNVTDQLRKGKNPQEVYDFVFGLQYLKPQYSLTYNDQEISELSPGERGLLLLVFYLLVDKDDIPLVIDQPEENLDNQTIFKILVTCIKKAKERRQVIIVTHNPNLAVVCDAEQIIYASCDKNNNRFSYDSGPIESKEIKARVVEILEGTKPAFDNRKNKYESGRYLEQQ